MNYEYTLRRRAELTAKLGNDSLDQLLEKEAKQHAARMACRAIGYHVTRETQHAAWVRYGR